MSSISSGSLSGFLQKVENIISLKKTHSPIKIGFSGKIFFENKTVRAQPLKHAFKNKEKSATYNRGGNMT